MRTCVILLWIVSAIPILAGCEAAQKSSAIPPQPARHFNAPAPADSPAAAPAQNSGGLRTLASRHPALLEYDGSAEATHLLIAHAPASQPDRLLIYTATLQMAVPDVEDTLVAVQKLGESAGGYLHHMSTESITIRIPAARFREILDKLRTLGQIVSKQIDAQDVTDEYVDLRLRLKNSEALMERLSALLAKAETTKDTLEIEREMTRLRVEIERIKGRLTQLDRLITYSTITVNCVKASAAVVISHRPESPFPWINELGVESVLRIRERGGE